MESEATQGVLDASIATYRASAGYHRMFFVCHSPIGSLSAGGPDVIILTGSDLARRIIDAGLFGWLIERNG